MKKIFAQPEMMVVNVKRNDIITDSIPMDPSSTNMLESGEILAPGQRGVFDWDAGY
ncbi:MAG: hypothetical protein IJS49_04085 [Paludibacteraceae bacterium]|nr:hypothetical protein [Paludibacteraceae bacterium]